MSKCYFDIDIQCTHVHLVYDRKVCMINKCFSSIETTSLNDRFFQSFAKVRISSILATLPSYFFITYSLSYQQDRLSFTKQAVPSTNLPFRRSKNARFRRSFRLAVSIYYIMYACTLYMVSIHNRIINTKYKHSHVIIANTTNV